MVEREMSVDEAIDQAAGESDSALQGVQEALAKAQESMDSARVAIQDAASAQPRDKSLKAADRARIFLEDAKRYLTQARDAIGRLAARAREQAEALYSKLKEQYEALVTRTRDLYERLKERVAELDLKGKGEQVLEYIRSNPGKSIMVALAVGFVIGYATRPRD
jgi:ElaB/YqjD/DUF883 family membrane-anchored ribosome-binding protein